MGNLYAVQDGASMADQTERLPIKDAAAQLGVSIDTVRRHLRTGKLHGEFVGGKWRVDVPAGQTRGADGASVPSREVIVMLERQLEYRHEEALRMQAILEGLLAERGSR